MAATGLYVHIPFCQAKCSYCDFPSYAGLQKLYGDYVEALCREASRCASAWGDSRFDTIFFGGGTPSVLPPSEIARVLAASRQGLHVQDDAEITIEANPGTVGLGDLIALRQAGVNRLSLGVQSLHDSELRLLGRIHDAGQAVRAYGLARQAGFRNISLDLIFGLPAQHFDSWRETVVRALDLEPEHLSLYALSVEEGTPLARQIAEGLLPPPDDDLAADMYEMAEETLDRAGYEHYEISNWARRGRERGNVQDPPTLACKHNIKYWTDQPYLGLGTAAHSYDGLHRWANTSDPAEYIERMMGDDDAVVQIDEIGPSRHMSDWMILGLRLVAGVTWRAFKARFVIELRAVYGKQIDELAAGGLLTVDTQGVRLTTRGRLLGNRAFVQFLR